MACIGALDPFGTASRKTIAMCCMVALALFSLWTDSRPFVGVDWELSVKLVVGPLPVCIGSQLVIGGGWGGIVVAVVVVVDIPHYGPGMPCLSFLAFPRIDDGSRGLH